MEFKQSGSQPTQCPVCGSTEVKKNSLSIVTSERIPPHFLSFRCENGHVFVVEKFKAIGDSV